MTTEKKALGRGLDALFGGGREEARAVTSTSGGLLKTSKMMPVSQLRANPNQPRRLFDKEALDQLAASIAEHGVLQPVLVRPILGEPGQYEIIAGERRWRAAQQARVHEIPVVVRDFTDREALEIGLVENLQRADLTPIEEAEGYQRLMDEFGHTQEKLAEIMGKSRPHIANMLRMLKLPDSVQRMVNDGRLSAGHARALLGTENPEALAEQVLKNRLSVRETENLAGSGKGLTATSSKGTAKGATAPVRDVNIVALERDLTNRTGLRIQIEHNSKNPSGGGQMVIHYQSLDQLGDIIAKL